MRTWGGRTGWGKEALCRLLCRVQVAECRLQVADAGHCGECLSLGLLTLSMASLRQVACLSWAAIRFSSCCLVFCARTHGARLFRRVLF